MRVAVRLALLLLSLLLCASVRVSALLSGLRASTLSSSGAVVISRTQDLTGNRWGLGSAPTLCFDGVGNMFLKYNAPCSGCGGPVYNYEYSGNRIYKMPKDAAFNGQAFSAETCPTEVWPPIAGQGENPTQTFSHGCFAQADTLLISQVNIVNATKSSGVIGAMSTFSGSFDPAQMNPLVGFGDYNPASSRYYGPENMVLSKDQRTAYFIAYADVTTVFEYNLCGDGSTNALFTNLPFDLTGDVWDLAMLPVGGVDRYLLAAFHGGVVLYDLQSHDFRAGAPWIIDTRGGMYVFTISLNSEGDLFMGGRAANVPPHTQSILMRVPSAQLLDAIHAGTNITFAQSLELVINPAPTSYFRTMRFDPSDQLYTVTYSDHRVVVMQVWNQDNANPTQPNAGANVSLCVMPTQQSKVTAPVAPPNVCANLPGVSSGSHYSSSSSGNGPQCIPGLTCAGSLAVAPVGVAAAAATILAIIAAVSNA